MRTDATKLSRLAHKLLFSLTMAECIKIVGSQAGAYRYMKQLKEVYHCDIKRTDNRYRLESVGDQNVWRGIFEILQEVEMMYEDSRDEIVKEYADKIGGDNQTAVTRAYNELYLYTMIDRILKNPDRYRRQGESNE